MVTLKYFTMEINYIEVAPKIIKNCKFKLELFIFIKAQN